ncbi:MAG: spore germination protein [Bacillota bacterium]|nr:spore germination protein [Bacillota bacterium]
MTETGQGAPRGHSGSTETAGRGKDWALEKVPASLATVRRTLDRELGSSFDIIKEELEVAGRQALIVGIDGLVDQPTLQQAVRKLLQAKPPEGGKLDADRLIREDIPFMEAQAESSWAQVMMEILSGGAVLFVDGLEQAILIDVRGYPARQPSEPDLEKVLRGPKDGFVETIIKNTALVRRRLRDKNLRIETFFLGRRSQTQVAMLYIKDITQPDLVDQVRRRLNGVRIDALPMAERSVEEFLEAREQAWFPFPLVRHTERPDVVAAQLLEGQIAILVDTSPVAMLLPATLPQLMQHPEEFHETSVPGMAVRFARYLGLLVAWSLVPVWILLATHVHDLPGWLHWIGPKKPGSLPLAAQFLIAETGLEFIRLALIHTPNALSTSLGVIGAVLVGQLAVSVGLFTAEVILYATVAAVGTFTIPSPELGNSVRLMRIFLILLVWIGDWYGLAVGALAEFAWVLRGRSFGVPYLWPYLPPDWASLRNVALRLPAPRTRQRPARLQPVDPDRQPAMQPAGRRLPQIRLRRRLPGQRN